MELIGTIVRLQVQRSSLKVGERPRRRYDPAPLLAVPTLTLTVGGTIGRTEDGEEIVDVHHRDHPASRNAGGENDVSVGCTSHYDAMRSRLGAHLADGLAGENILVRTDRVWHEAELAGGILVEADGGEWVRLDRVVVAEPCVEFSRYALCAPDDTATDGRVTETLRFLRDGTRGFYASYRGEPRALRVGDRVFRA